MLTIGRGTGTPTQAVMAEDLRVPENFNAVSFFLDRHIDEGRGGRTAIVSDAGTVTYQQVFENANRFGSALRSELGVRQEERVLLLLLDSPAYATCFWGAMKIGAVPIPTNTLLRPADYEYILNDSRARVAIVSASLLPLVEAIPREQRPHLAHIVVDGPAPDEYTSLKELLSRGSPQLQPAATKRDDTAFWLYSSGSTGFPKGCVHLHHDMVLCTELYAKGVLNITQDDRCFSVAKLFFAYGLGNGLYFPFAVGGTAITLSGPPTAASVFATIQRFRPTLLFSVPTSYGMMLAHKPEEGQPEFDLSGIRWGVSAGEALPPALFERFKSRFGVTVLDGIGSTEILHIFISNQPGAIRPGASGRVVPGYEAKLLDEDDQPLPQGEVGNLLIKGDSTCAYYWNKHPRTKDTISGHWIRTGDKYSQDGDGYYWYAGRSDDMLKVGGIWVSPVEVENALMEHADVQEAAVVAREDQDKLIKPAAYVVLRAGVQGSDDLARELQTFVRQQLADYKRPRWVEFVDELPKTATGKTQRFKLRQTTP